MESKSGIFEIVSKTMESRSWIFEIFQTTVEVQIQIIWNIFKNREVQILDFWNIFKKCEVQIFEFYTNPRLGPDYGFWNGIFTIQIIIPFPSLTFAKMYVFINMVMTRVKNGSPDMIPTPFDGKVDEKKDEIPPGICRPHMLQNF